MLQFRNSIMSESINMGEGPETFLSVPLVDKEEYHNENDMIIPAKINPRLPNGIIVAVLMVVGLVGNSLVLYVYNFRMPRTVFSLFVTVLALLDLTTTLLAMPIDVVIKSFVLSDMDAMNVICKIAHLENYGTSLTSGSVLLLIAVTRHRKVCQPLEPSLTRRSARIMCAIIFAVAMLLCSVTLVINGPEMVKIALGYVQVPVSSTNTTDIPQNMSQSTESSLGLKNSTAENETVINVEKRQVVEVHICRTSEEYKGTVLYYVMYSILSVAFVSILLSLVVLHCRISNSVKQFQRRQSRMRSSSIYSDDSHNTDNINSKMFRIFASITVVFIVSYLPHLICMIVEQSLYRDLRPMPQYARIIMDLAYNSPYLNVIANPFIYGYRSEVFREHCIILFYRCCCWCCWHRRYG